MPAFEVRDPTAADRAQWRRLWSANCAHFGARMAEDDDGELWRRIMDPNHAVNALVCSTSASGGGLIGLAHYVLHPHTFSNRLVCYLEDLWVEPSARRTGVARSLIDALVARGRENGWRRVYWHTEADNTAARDLYDRIARATSYVRYDLALP